MKPAPSFAGFRISSVIMQDLRLRVATQSSPLKVNT